MNVPRGASETQRRAIVFSLYSAYGEGVSTLAGVRGYVAFPLHGHEVTAIHEVQALLTEGRLPDEELAKRAIALYFKNKGKKQRNAPIRTQPPRDVKNQLTTHKILLPPPSSNIGFLPPSPPQVSNQVNSFFYIHLTS